jgi:hypothetical protein
MSTLALQEVSRRARTTVAMARRPKVVPRTLTSAEQRVLASFIAGRLSAGRLDAALEQARVRSAEPAAAGHEAALRAA